MDEKYKTKLEYYDANVRKILEKRKTYEKGSIYMRWSSDDLYHNSICIDRERKNNWAIMKKEMTDESVSDQYVENISYFDKKVSVLIPHYKYKMLCNSSSKKIAENICNIKSEKNNNNDYEYFISNNYGYIPNEPIPKANLHGR